MALTKQDLKSIGSVIDKKQDTKFKEFEKRLDKILDEKLDEKFVDHLTLLEKRLDKRMDKRFDEMNEKIDGVDKKLNEFVDFAKPAIESLLEESQQNFDQKLPQRVLTLEKLHSTGAHVHVN